MTYINKLPQSEVINLTQLVPVSEDQVASMTLVQRKGMGMTVFALDKDQSIGGHSSPGDAMVNLLSGKVEITIGEEKFLVEEGETIVMPANIPHALYALEAFQMLLVVVKPEKVCKHE
ncbi:MULTISPECIES: cupin domain-containing protein [Enterococcus]|uniref:Cupin type-2 domain-containing protein n=1 Tax=Candidatus Enterococcus ferrettii TaxID=2815324 RepID=A0ABV0ERZ7_9ENTE|nr:cupin domain-containing protein [Enterococcus sp. 665A]MBO1341329.1 cupin domain-containing protein [Enterococcus sp. 665A]